MSDVILTWHVHFCPAPVVLKLLNYLSSHVIIKRFRKKNVIVSWRRLVLIDILDANLHISVVMNSSPYETICQVILPPTCRQYSGKEKSFYFIRAEAAMEKRRF